MTKSEIKTLNYYDGISQGYKNLYHEEQILKIVKIKHLLPTKGILLDLGSGDGVLNQFIPKEVKLISQDLSFELLKLNSNLNKIQSSILNLPFKNNSINFISSFTVFQDLTNIKKAINETKRILNKDGIFIISFLKQSQYSVKLIKLIENNFKIIEKYEETKDYIFVLKNN